MGHGRVWRADQCEGSMNVFVESVKSHVVTRSWRGGVCALGGVAEAEGEWTKSVKRLVRQNQRVQHILVGRRVFNRHRRRYNWTVKESLAQRSSGE